MKKVFGLAVLALGAAFVLASCGKKGSASVERSYVMTTVVYPEDIALWRDGSGDNEGKMVSAGITVYPGTVLDAVKEGETVVTKNGVRASDGESREYVKVYFDDEDLWAQKNLVMVNSYSALVKSDDSQILYNKPQSDGISNVEVPAYSLVAVSLDAEQNGFRKISYWSTDAKGKASKAYTDTYLKSSAFESLEYPSKKVAERLLSKRTDLDYDIIENGGNIYKKETEVQATFEDDIKNNTALYALQDSTSLWNLNDGGNLVYKMSVPAGTALEEDGSDSYVLSYESSGKIQSQKLTVVKVKYEGNSYYVMKNKIAKGALAYTVDETFYCLTQELYTISKESIPGKTMVVVSALKNVNWLDNKNIFRLYTTYYYNTAKNSVSKVYAFGFRTGKLGTFIMDKDSLEGMKLYTKAFAQKTDKVKIEMLSNINIDKVSPCVADWTNEAMNYSLYEGSKVMDELSRIAEEKMAKENAANAQTETPSVEEKEESDSSDEGSLADDSYYNDSDLPPHDYEAGDGEDYSGYDDNYNDGPEDEDNWHNDYDPSEDPSEEESDSVDHVMYD